MMYGKKFSIILLTCFSFFLLITGLFTKDMVNTAYAAQTTTKQETRQANPRTISGKVTEVITAAGITYAEVDTGKEKVWAAQPAVTPLKEGDPVAFTTEMPMQNYHSKTLDRDFSLIYFVKQFITDKEATTIDAPQGQTSKQQTIKHTPGEVLAGGLLRDMTMTGLNGKNKKLSDFRGLPLIINVWTSWCGPCRAEMGSLERLAKQYNGKAFNVIGVSTDDYRDKAAAFIEQSGTTFDNFHDDKLILEDMLGASTIPLTVFVDEHGRVLEKVRGAREWDDPKIIAAIAEVFNIKLSQ